MPWGARSPTEIEHGFFSGFPRMQSGMLLSYVTQFLITEILTYTYMYSHVVRTSKYF